MGDIASLESSPFSHLSSELDVEIASLFGLCEAGLRPLVLEEVEKAVALLAQQQCDGLIELRGIVTLIFFLILDSF